MRITRVAVLLCLAAPVNSFVNSGPSSFRTLSTERNLFNFDAPPVVQETLRSTISVLDQYNQKLNDIFENDVDTILDDLTEAIVNVQYAFERVDEPVLAAWNEFVSDFERALAVYLERHPTYQPYYSLLKEKLVALSSNIPAFDHLPGPVSTLFTATLTYAALTSLLNIGEGPPPSRPYPLKRYDAASARAYFDKRLPLVIQRGVDLFTTSLGFGLSLLDDKINGKLEENANERAIELAQLLTKLGPSFIKIGQSLSIRTDLLSPAYVRGLQSLQDQVPAFDSKIALQILEDEWGVPVNEVVSDITAEPVAAASLGQVYKATLKENGMEVAIKVQRPDILEQIALDMHLLREMAPVAKRTFNLNTDTVGTVDAWGTGFVDELDYLSEARNAETFMDSIQTTPLKDVVFSPPVIKEFSSEKVLTTEWVDGERLDRSSNEDVTVLCSIAMNTYLTMMLETGLLHCDPHPGNLLRTPEGKLCILDWGMVTRLDSGLQLTLIEHMAHLTSADYAEIPRDLLLLDFIPAEKSHLIKDSGVVEVLADIYGAWTKGGGAAAINVNQVVAQLQDLTATRGNLFQIPPYFAYIAKSFSVLEGIGLSNDSNYSIINECLPYVSKRLLTDRSQRTGGALSTFIFGPDKANIDTRIVDYDRVEQLVEGFGSYTTSASGALLGKEGQSRTQLLEGAADQLLDLIFVEEETPLQTILLEQMAKIVTAASRSAWARIRDASGTLPSGRSVLGTLVDPLGLWRTSPLVQVDDLDEYTIETTQKLVQLMQAQAQESNNPMFDLNDLSQEEIRELATILVRKVWDRRSGILKTGGRFASTLLQLTANKLEKGERVPLRQKPQEDSPTVETSRPARSPPSERLQSARRLLSELESDSFADAQFVQPMPVKNK